MKLYIRLLILFFCLLTPLYVCANNLRQISSRDGLSNSSVYCLYQDDERFLWIGTFDGLNRYDGQNIHIYKPDINNRYSLSSNVIRSIVETEGDYLWISTKWGLNKLSQKENIIVEYHNDFKEDSHITKDNQGRLYVQGKTGLLSVYNEADHSFIDMPINKEAICQNIDGLFIDANDTLWMNHQGIFERYIVSFTETGEPQISRQADYPHPHSILFATFNRGRILFVDAMGNLYSVNPRKTVFIRNISSLLKENGEISSILYNYNDILIGFKTNGLVRLQAQEQYREERIDINCGVFSLWKDEHQDIVWIGTDGQGVYAWTKDDYTFKNITLAQLPVKKQRPIRAIHADSRNDLWMGTKDNGVIRIREYANRKEYVTQDINHFTTENGLTNNGVFAFAPSQNPHILWIGSDGPGVNYYSYTDRKIHTVANNTSTKITFVHSLFESRDSTLWIGSGNSLLKMTIDHQHHQSTVTASKRFSFNLKNNQPYNQIYALHQESDSIIWIGIRGNGIIRFNAVTEQYRLFSFEKGGIAPMNDILCIYQEENGILWLGTSYGLIRFVMFPDGNYEYRNYNENDGLPNNSIHGILEAPDNKLWLSSNTGIILFDPTLESFRNFNHKTGLKTIEFSDNAYFKDPKTSACFFGGVDGIIWIKKEEIERKRFIPEIQFTQIRIFNEDYMINDFERKKKGVSYIELNNKQNFFAVSFIAVDFINGENSRYAYQLENFSNVWMDTRSNEAQFTNIPPGNYTLRVRYNDGTDNMEDQIQSIRIVILPPWYLSIYAKIVYILLFLGIIYGVFLYTKFKYEKKKRKTDRQLKQKYKEEMYEGKLRFFTNITHEFSTPLTLIHGPCERILANSKIDSSVRKYAQIIRSNTERLHTLIQEIIDFRRMETGHKALHIKEINISQLTQNIAVAFDELAEQNNISFHVEVSPGIIWDTDISGYTKIISNLISNAFKYTPEKGTINVSVERKEHALVLKVYNTGKGIEEENIPLIFNRYSVLDNVRENSIKGLSSRNGLGLAICHSLTELLQGTIQVKSEVNQYTEFIVSLPCLEVHTHSSETIAFSDIQSNAFIYNEQISAASSELSKSEGNTRKRFQEKVLIIDDNKDLLWMLEDILSDEYHIYKAEDGKEGLEILKKETPDIIITDIMMPEIDGITLTRKIKGNKHTMHIPLVILSAKNSNEEKIIGIESGADAYIAKPFHSEYLKAVIRHQIKSKKTLKQYYNSSASAFQFNNGQLIEKEDKDFLQSVVEIINRNLDNTDFSTEDLAGEMQISVRNLYRKFKELNQPTPNERIKELRLIQAARLLVTTTFTVLEIMYKTGFNNRSHFHREFSKRYEKTPKEYREENKLKDHSL